MFIHFSCLLRTCIINYIYCRDEHLIYIHLHLPLLQREPFHPTTHPSSHWPVTWLHVVLPLQCSLHIPLHSTPYLHTAHSFKANYISLVYPPGIKVYISRQKLFVAQWPNSKLHAQNLGKIIQEKMKYRLRFQQILN